MFAPRNVVHANGRTTWLFTTIRHLTFPMHVCHFNKVPITVDPHAPYKSMVIWSISIFNYLSNILYSTYITQEYCSSYLKKLIVGQCVPPSSHVTTHMLTSPKLINALEPMFLGSKPYRKLTIKSTYSQMLHDLTQHYV